MGRMLDAFQHGRSRPGFTEVAAPALHTIWPEEDSEDGGPAEDEVPFIEVGGPVSAERKAPSPEREDVKSPHAASPAPRAASIAEQWMTVRYRPVPVAALPQTHLSRFAPELIAFHQPDHAISLQYRDLATSLLAQTPAEQPRVLYFTAAAAGVGTTTVLLNTALTLARDNLLRVVVLDAHLRRAAIAERLGLPEGTGLRDVLSGRAPLEEAVRTTGLPGLSVLGAGSAEGVSPARLAGESMRAVLRQLREHHDLVLVDGPCWDGRPEVVALGCACDAVYLCLPESQENAPETADLLQIIPEQGASLRGCILTQR